MADRQSTHQPTPEHLFARVFLLAVLVLIAIFIAQLDLSRDDTQESATPSPAQIEQQTPARQRPVMEEDILLADMSRIIRQILHDQHMAYLLEHHNAPYFRGQRPMATHLIEYLEQFGGNMAIFYRNLDSGYTIVHNPDQIFPGASVPKAFYSFYLYQLAEEGEIDLEEMLTYTNADYRSQGGTQIGPWTRIGSQFSVRHLVYWNMPHSDNASTRILTRSFGIDGFRDFAESLGARDLYSNVMINSPLTARQAAIFAEAMWAYVHSDGQFSAEFRENLATNHYPYLSSSYPILSKTGWHSGVTHDMAIVQAPSPYILVMLTNWADSGQTRQRFADVSEMFEQFNDEWFVSDGIAPISPAELATIRRA